MLASLARRAELTPTAQRASTVGLLGLGYSRVPPSSSTTRAKEDRCSSETPGRRPRIGLTASRPRGSAGGCATRGRLAAGASPASPVGCASTRATWRLEGGEFVRIPERPDVTDALRTYIDYLNLDGEELVASAQSAADRADAPPGHGERGRSPGPRRRKSVMMAVLLVLAAASYVGYRVARQPDPATARLTAAVHEGTATDMPRGREAE